MDALAMLREDHREAKRLFKRFEGAGDRAHKTKRKVADEIIRELSIHAAVEEQVFYPTVRERAGETEEMVLEALEEHHIVKTTLSELEKMDPKDERFDAKVSVLIESVRHHMKEEEEDLFKRVRKAFKPAELRELGDLMEEAKAAAPTRPHPKAPDEPPANLVTGPAAAVMDAGKDLVRGVAERGRSKQS